MRPYEYNLNRIMIRVRHAFTPVVYPAYNPELMVLLLRLYKRKYGYTTRQLSFKLQVPYQTVADWFFGKYSATLPHKKYNHVMNYLENHS